MYVVPGYLRDAAQAAHGGYDRRMATAYRVLPECAAQVAGDAPAMRAALYRLALRCRLMAGLDAQTMREAMQTWPGGDREDRDAVEAVEALDEIVAAYGRADWVEVAGD